MRQDDDKEDPDENESLRESQQESQKFYLLPQNRKVRKTVQEEFQNRKHDN